MYFNLSSDKLFVNLFIYNFNKIKNTYRKIWFQDEQSYNSEQKAQTVSLSTVKSLYHSFLFKQ